MIFQWTLRLLLGAIGLPILMCLLFGLAYLLAALDDGPGAMVVRRINLGLSVLWVFDLLLLLIVLAFMALRSSEETRRHGPNQDTDDLDIDQTRPGPD